MPNTRTPTHHLDNDQQPNVYQSKPSETKRGTTKQNRGTPRQNRGTPNRDSRTTCNKHGGQQTQHMRRTNAKTTTTKHGSNKQHHSKDKAPYLFSAPTPAKLGHVSNLGQFVSRLAQLWPTPASIFPNLGRISSQLSTSIRQFCGNSGYPGVSLRNVRRGIFQQLLGMLDFLITVPILTTIR